MTLVTVTGNVSDFAGINIPVLATPELWFRPEKSKQTTAGLRAGVEVKATLTASTGDFEVELDNDSSYVPVLRWVVNYFEDLPEKRSWGYTEWDAFHPGFGGDIGHMLPPHLTPRTAYYFGALSDPPPAGFRGYWEVQAEPGREDSEDPFIGDVRRVYGG